MRLYEFQRTGIDPKQAQYIIYTECSLMKDAPPLFRGGGQTMPYFVSEIRQNRQARTSEDYEVEMFNLLMQDLELPFRKNNTLSVSVNLGDAKSYGSNVYKIYPFDGSSYLGSTKHSDFLSITDHILESFYKTPDAANAANDVTVDAPSMVEIGMYIKNQSHILANELGLFSTDNPKDLFKAKGEIIIYKGPYVAVEVN